MRVICKRRNKLYDVVVIGGGPVGSQVAFRLAGMGYGVVVAERKERLEEPVCCTGIISRECVRAFDIDEAVIYRWTNSARLFSPSGKLLRVYRQEPQAAIVNRPALNLVLATRARDRGAEYITGCRVSGIEFGQNDVKVEVVHQGERVNLEARSVVITGGFNPGLVAEAGLGRFADSVMGAQAEVGTTGVDEVEVYCGGEVAHSFFAWLVPTSPDRALVGLLSRRTPGHYLEKLITSLVAEGKITPADVDLSYGGVPLKPLSRTYGNRMLVVGTAAGQVKPTTGGGIYFGLLAADIAANTLEQALKADTLSARYLAGYQRTWKRKLGRELRRGYRARKIYEMLNDRQIDKIFDLIISSGITEELAQAEDLSFDWHGQVISRALTHGVFLKAVRAIKIPFLMKKRNRG